MGLGLWSQRMCGPSATPSSFAGLIYDSSLGSEDYVAVAGWLSLDTSGDLTTVAQQLHFQREQIYNCLASSQG